MSDTEKDVRIYELGYWFVPTIAESAVETQVTELKKKLQSHGVDSFIQEEAPYLREISYEMKKVINNQNNYFTEGYFGWMKFEMQPSEAGALTHELELDPAVIRSLLIQTVRENTVLTKRPSTFKRADDIAAIEDEVSQEIAKEEISEEEPAQEGETEVEPKDEAVQVKE